MKEMFKEMQKLHPTILVAVPALAELFLNLVKQFGLNMLGEDDILVVMGKGAENFQKIGREKIPYSDLDIVQELIKKMEVK